MKAVFFIIFLSIPVFCMAQGEKKNGWTKQGLKGKVKTLRSSTDMSAKVEELRNKSFSDKDYGVDSFSNTGQHIKFYLFNDGKTITKTEFKYDARGSLIEEMKNKKGEITKMTYKIKYDGAGNKIETKIFENGVLQGWSRYKYKMGKLAEAEDSIAVFGKSSEVNKYDNKGRVVERENYYPSDPQSNSIVKYQYDDKGNTTEIAEYYPDRTLKYRTVYKYDDHNNTILAESYDNNGKLKNSSATEYIYDSHGNYLRKIQGGGYLSSLIIQEIVYY